MQARNMAILFSIYPRQQQFRGGQVRNLTGRRGEGDGGGDSKGKGVCVWGVHWQAHASFTEGGGIGAATQLQSFVAMWECGPSVARSSDFFFFPREARNLEFYEKSSNF